MDFVTTEKLTIVGAAGMIGSNMAQTALMMRLTPNICLYDPFGPALEGVAEELFHCGFEGVNITWTTDVGGPRDVHPFETAVEQLFGHAFERRTERVVKADVGRQAHHQRRLGHVRADHAGRTHNGKLFSCYEIHDFIV